MAETITPWTCLAALASDTDWPIKLSEASMVQSYCNKKKLSILSSIVRLGLGIVSCSHTMSSARQEQSLRDPTMLGMRKQAWPRNSVARRAACCPFEAILGEVVGVLMEILGTLRVRIVETSLVSKSISRAVLRWEARRDLLTVSISTNIYRTV